MSKTPLLYIKRDGSRDDSILPTVAQPGPLKPGFDIGFDTEIRNLRHAAQLKKRDEVITSLRSQVKIANEKLEESDQGRAAVHNVNYNLHKQWTKAMEEKDQATERLYPLQKQIQELKSDNWDLEDRLEESRSKRRSLQKDHVSQAKLLETQIRETRQKVQELDTELKNTRKKKEGLAQILQESRSTINLRNGEVERLKKETKGLKEDKAAMTKELQAVHEEQKLQNQKLKAVEEEFKSVQEERGSLCLEIQRLRKKQVAQSTRHRTLQDQLNQAKLDIAQIQTERDNLSVQLEKSQLEALQRQFDETHENMKTMEAELERKTKSLANMDTLNNDLHGQINDLTVDNRYLHSMRERAAAIEEEYAERFKGNKKRKVGALSQKN